MRREKAAQACCDTARIGLFNMKSPLYLIDKERTFCRIVHPERA
jgi:hypothetical protein